MKIRDILGDRLLLLDGGMGTQLQARGLAAGELPELWNITRPDTVKEIHSAYLAAGCDIVLSNTFGANALKLTGEHSVEEVVDSGVRLAKAATSRFSTAERPRFVALDLGPTGKLLKPMGDLEPERCIELYAQAVRAGAAAGADLVFIETMSDTLEIKCAVLAAKENCNLPILASVVFDEQGKLLTGADVETTAVLLESLGVDAIGINCGLGPVQMLPLIQELAKNIGLPIFAKPNAGLPVRRDGEDCYDMDARQFAEAAAALAGAGIFAVGGCCGTTPEHIAGLSELCEGVRPTPPQKQSRTVVSGYARCQQLGVQPVIIGERINPTGKKRFKQALVERDMDYILGEGILQQQCGAQILDVNTGLPEIDEAELLQSVVAALQGVTDLPLQIDTSDVKALEAALRVYNGKPLINSVNGKAESMATVFPLVKKYGGVVVGLTLDDDGIPPTAQGRLAVARKLVETAATYGIDKRDLIIDVLTMTISAEPQSAGVTLEALELVRRELGVCTVLGVSNISFGLPRRELINASFFTMALGAGLSAAIINPCSEGMMASYHSYLALTGCDAGCMGYIDEYSGTKQAELPQQGDIGLEQAVERGLRDRAGAAATGLLAQGERPLEIIAARLVPALDRVGKGFEQRTVFLPQLLMSAEAAKAAFAVLREAMQRTGEQQARGEKVLLATVKGDIHDIGKNIVKVLLENYGFEVLDLGKDVSPQIIAETVAREGIRLVGLSALMTTTVVSMRHTIELLKASAPECRVMVGGAVLTKDYADAIGASFYSPDAMGAVNYAKNLFTQE